MVLQFTGHANNDNWPFLLMQIAAAVLLVDDDDVADSKSMAG